MNEPKQLKQPLLPLCGSTFTAPEDLTQEEQ